MARRRRVDDAAVEHADAMPAELHRRPATQEEIDRWLDGDRMPATWDFGGEIWWRRITAHGRWSRARHAWRVEHDRACWWYWKSRNLPVPPRSQREAYRQEIN